MMKAKIFENGRSQAVRLPKEYRFDCDEVYINKIGDVVMLIPENKDEWKNLKEAIEMFSEDFMEDRYRELLEKENRK